MAATYSAAPYGTHLPASSLPPTSSRTPQPVPSPAPPGTLIPGTIVRVGQYTVRVDKFLSQGGFAHVYLASSESPIPAGSPSATTKHVLKRIAVPDKAGVEEVGKEVEVMKLLRNHPKIVNFIEASVSELPAGSGSKGYEIYILMEWCAGGGIIDMMNTRLQNRLTESEILKIFSDTVEAVAHMHYQSPPLIHRDLKVENILLTPPQTFKLCDFGSTTTPITGEKVPTGVTELQKMESEINKTTTLQYRAPELVDVWGRKGFDEKIDIWALGVLLYKLCYYTTPFEDHGPLSILNATYKIPPYPAYSNAIKTLIGGMLQERASARPNIYQLHEQVCRLRGSSVKLDNIYGTTSTSSRSSSQSSKPASAFSTIISSGPAPNFIPSGPSLAETISPMRRGRPGKSPGIVVPPSSASSAPAQDNRMVRTGLASVQGGGEESRKMPPWEMTASPPIGMSSALGGGGGGATSLSPPEGNSWGAKNGHHGMMGSSSAPISAATSGNGNNGFGDAFEVSRTSSGQGGAGAGGGGGAGFGDSFQPNSTSPALFSDLLPPSRSPAPGTLQNKTGDLADGSAPRVPPKSVGASAYDSLGFDSKTTLPSSFSPSTSSAPLPASFTPSNPPLPSRPTGESNATKSFPQLTGDNEGPPLPRRPPVKSGSKPELISRSSQTSPRLMATWRPPVGSNTGPTSSSLSQSTLPPSSQASWQKKPQVDLLGDDDDDEDAFLPSQRSGAFLPTSTPLITNATPSVGSALPPSGIISSKRDSLYSSTYDFNVDAARAKFRPVRPSETSPSSSSSAPKAEPASMEAKDRFPSLDNLEAYIPRITARPKSTTTAAAQDPPPPPPPNARVEVETWQPIVEKDGGDISSDDEPEVEDFAPRQRGVASGGPRSTPAVEVPSKPTPNLSSHNLPPIERLDSVESVGGIDLAPALASIRRFAPQGNDNAPPPFVKSPPPGGEWASSAPSRAPLVAPKPQSVKRQAAISSLVSRYETISMEPTSPKEESRRPPPTAAKPASLRRDSLDNRPNSATSANSSSTRPRKISAASHWSSPKASVDDFQQRFPDSNALDDHFAASPLPSPLTSNSNASVTAAAPIASTLPTSASFSRDRLPFKPVPAPSPSSPTAPVRSFAKPPPPPAPAADEEEEAFAGVKNMKSRYEALSASGTSGPGRPAVRKEWGVV